MTDASGTLISEQRYLPFGEVRTDVGEITQTDFGYTGQRGLPGTGLMDYRARFYEPALGRFHQPDSIVPGTENPQAWNRYSYVLNSPLDYIDPTGHDPHWCEDDASCRTDYLNSMMGLWRSAHHGGSGGGGENGKDDPRENNYYVRSDPTLYLLGWENFETAWSIWTNSDFNYWQRFGAGAYMGAWGGAHVGLLVGAAGMACVAAGPGCVQVVEGALGIGTYLGADGDPTNEASSMSEVLWRFSEKSGEFYNGLKKGEEAMSLWRAADFRSPLDAFRVMAPNGDPSKAIYQITNVGTAIRNGFYPVYNNIPSGHVNLYGNTWGNSIKAIFDYFGGPWPVLPP